MMKLGKKHASVPEYIDNDVERLPTWRKGEIERHSSY